MKQMKTIRSLIVLLTAICFGLAVIAFFLPHGIGTVCAIGTVALAALVLILCLVYGALYFGQRRTAADAADAEYRDARIAEPPHAVLAEDERCPYKSLVHDETIFLTANEPIRILYKFR